MSFQPPVHHSVPELILIFGLDGSGKSLAWAELRSFYEQTGTPGHFHVLNTEPGHRAEMMAQAYRSGESGKNFDSNATIYECVDWGTLVAQSRKVRENAVPGDWVVVDSVGFGWEWAQDDYIQRALGKSREDFFADGGGRLNWQVINNDYRSWFGPLLDLPCHKLLIARTEKVKLPEGKPGEWATAPETRQLFERHGWFPVGQKHMPYTTPTRIWLEESADGYLFSVLKDQPGRGRVTRQPMLSFPTSYLLACAGWDIT